MRQAAAVFLFVLSTPFLALAAPATLPTQTSDGVAYGDAQPIKGFNPPNLPTIGRVLGVPAAEWVGHRKVITRTQSSAEVQKIEQREQPGYVGNGRPPEFVVVESANHYQAFDIDHGRIVRVITRNRPVSNEAIEAAAKSINAVGSKLSPPASASGGGMFGVPLIVSYRPDTWLLMVDPPSPEIASAIRNQQVIVGMTESQADAAMWAYEKQVADANAASRLVRYYSEQIVSGGAPPQRSDKCLIDFESGVVTRVSQ